MGMCCSQAQLCGKFDKLVCEIDGTFALIYSSFRTWLWSNQLVHWEQRKTKGKKCAQSTSSAQSISSRSITGLLPYPIRGYSSNTSYSSLHYYHVQGCINSTMAMFMACSQEHVDDFWMSSCGSLHHAHPRIWSLDQPQNLREGNGRGTETLGPQGAEMPGFFTPQKECQIDGCDELFGPFKNWLLMVWKVCGGIPTILGLVYNAAGHQFGGTTKHAY